MHCVGSAVIAAKATKWQKEMFLEPIAQGQHITTLALSESGTGAHFYFPQTTLQRMEENQYLINGQKTFVTNGAHADSYVLSTMAASSEASASQFSCVVMPEHGAGMEWGQEWDGLGMRGNSSRSLRIRNAFVTGDQILGERGDQLWYVFTVVAPYFLIAMAGTYLGVATRAMEEARNALSKRTYTYNGTNLAQVPLLQHRLGNLWAYVERTKRLIYSAAAQGDAGTPDSMLSILAAKAEAATCAVDVVNEAMTIAGGRGYEKEGILGRLLRDARAAHVMAPTTDILYTWIGRSLLDQPLLSD